MRCDVVVIGAGPAGLAAAAAAHGSVAVIDLAARAGGQFYRGPADAPPVPLAAECAARGVTMLTGRQVFLVEPGFIVHTDGEPVTADTVVIATGAHDRAVAFPGWDLPGVLTAGGAQALLKGNGVLPGRRIVVAGTGPFLLPVAAGLAAAGAKVAGVFEANSPAGFLRHAGVVARHPDKLAEAAGYLARLAGHRVPVRYRHAVSTAHGTDQVTGVTVAKVDREWRTVKGTERRVDCDTVAVGCGFVPRIDVGTALGCATDLVAGSPVLRVDGRQATSVPGVFAAGEVTGIGGVQLSLVEGRIAGLAASGVDIPVALERRRAGHRAFADALADVYPVREGWLANLTGDTLLCRCEEVDHDAVLAAVTDLGARDARAVKLLTRAGMGWCQGRMCGAAVAGAVAGLTGDAADPTDLTRRLLAQPVRLGDLANDNLEDR